MQKINTLLIIDDEADICLLLERLLKRHYQIIQSNYLLGDGLLKAQTLMPTHILLDNNLPDGYGVQAIARLRQIAPEARIVMMSAVDICNEAITAGADAFVSKPLNMALVRKALEIL